MLLIIGIKKVSDIFFKDVFGDADFSKIKEIRDKIERFRQIAMLEYGSFRYAYKMLREGYDFETENTVKDLVSKYFPDSDEVDRRINDFKDKAEPVGIRQIEASKLFALGYLSTKESIEVNDARKKLKSFLEKAYGESRIAAYKDLKSMAEKEGIKDLTILVNKAGVSDANDLLVREFKGGMTKKTYKELIADVKDKCNIVDAEAIRVSKKDGLLNTTAYLGMHDIDVYVATSMREALHFTTNNAFVNNLFSDRQLGNWKLRYFDPTLSYLPDRVQKGLLESLMIKRARVTIYNAQENDTFGKDSEAAVALAQGKDVIVYVTRLFNDNEKFKKLYKNIDLATTVKDAEKLVLKFHEMKLIDGEEKAIWMQPGMSKGDIIELYCKKYLSEMLKDMDTDLIDGELMKYGYKTEEKKEEKVNLTIRHISNLEKRALTFKDVHPLSFQVSAISGVSRGVIVTRTVEDTAYILRGLLLGNLEYEMFDDNFNTLLYEKRTSSPIRVVTKEPTLTTAFWSEFSRDNLGK